MNVSFSDYKFPLTGRFSIAVDDAEDEYTEWVRSHFGIPPQIELCVKLTEPGDTVVDVGANIGTFTLPLAATGRRVYAVEALSRNFSLLVRSVLRNGFDAVMPIHAAIWRTNTIVKLGGHSAWGHIRESEAGENAPAITLDDLCRLYRISNVKLLKVDIEGAELPMIEGTKQFFATNPDVKVIFESNNWTTTVFHYRYPKLLRAFEHLGFRLYLIQGTRLVPRDSSQFQEALCSDYLGIRGDCAPHVPGFTVAPLSSEESAEVVLEQTRQKPHRAYVLAEYERIPKDIRSVPRLADELERLKNDKDEELLEMVRILKSVPLL